MPYKTGKDVDKFKPIKLTFMMTPILSTLITIVHVSLAWKLNIYQFPKTLSYLPVRIMHSCTDKIDTKIVSESKC